MSRRSNKGDLHLLLAIPRHHVSASHVHSSSIVHSRPTVRANGYDGLHCDRADRLSVPDIAALDAARQQHRHAAILWHLCRVVQQVHMHEQSVLWVRSRRDRVCTVAAPHHTAVRATTTALVTWSMRQHMPLLCVRRHVQRRWPGRRRLLSVPDRNGLRRLRCSICVPATAKFANARLLQQYL